MVQLKLNKDKSARNNVVLTCVNSNDSVIIWIYFIKLNDWDKLV